MLAGIGVLVGMGAGVSGGGVGVSTAKRDAAAVVGAPEDCGEGVRVGVEMPDGVGVLGAAAESSSEVGRWLDSLPPGPRPSMKTKYPTAPIAATTMTIAASILGSNEP